MEALHTANSLYVEERYSEAIESYRAALESDPNSFETTANLAAAYLKLGQYDEASQASTLAISINPESYIGYLRQGLACYYREEFMTALNWFEQAESKKTGTSQKWILKCRAELAKNLTLTEKYEWYQNEAYVYIDVSVKSVGDPKVEIKARSISLRATTTRGTIYQLDLELAHPVDASESSFVVSPSKIELKLKKSEAVTWSSLSPVDLSASSRPSYPTSSKKKVDWDEMDKQASVELKKEKPEGEAALQELFKEIYSNADEDTRRAMIKSFQTSGGTVLSTNWGEVAAKDYEKADRPAPPEGQMWADWSQKCSSSRTL